MLDIGIKNNHTTLKQCNFLAENLIKVVENKSITYIKRYNKHILRKTDTLINEYIQQPEFRHLPANLIVR